MGYLGGVEVGRGGFRTVSGNEGFGGRKSAMTERPVTGTSSIPIDIMRVMELIPHRFPFLMVDRIVELALDEKARVGRMVRRPTPVLSVRSVML